ncbi:MAG: lysophospholipid acyltransferase family protein [Candidatus Thermoplasmatota archaeon]
MVVPAARKSAAKAAKPATRRTAPAADGPGGSAVARRPATVMPSLTQDEADPFDVEFVNKLAPALRTLRNYFRLKVDGLDHIPEKGPALLVANHTGWLGLDYALTALSVHDALERTPRGMAHEAWFKAPATRNFAKRVGLFQVTKDAMAQQLARGHLVMLFPEGEKGAFRPGSDYQLEPFARGFVRVAMANQVPVIPVAVLGGEESNPVGTRIEGYEQLLNMKGGIPIPKNILPKPVKWRIRFLKPMPFSDYGPQDADDTDRVHAIAEDVRTRVQRELRKMKVERGHPYI